ncbi:hypothetical protein Tco_0484217 [Tanacetum coccineum]
MGLIPWMFGSSLAAILESRDGPNYPAHYTFKVKVDLHSADDNLAPRLKNMCEAKVDADSPNIINNILGVLYSSPHGCPGPYANG